MIAGLIAVFCSMGCNKSQNAAAVSNDPVQARLRELAGGNAVNCGVLNSQAASDLAGASKCAMDAARGKTPFYVEYQLPGMNVAVAGNSQGKLYSVQSQSGGAGLTSSDCPADLRVAPSGRVSCYAPGTFPMGAGAGSHSGIPDMGTSGGALPAGHPSVQKQPAAPAKP